MSANNDVQPLFNEAGNLFGVFIPASKWLENQKTLEAILFSNQSLKPSSDPKPEPIKDWDLFFSCWDFNYPEEKNVRCKHCGASTEDWTQDEPRKFILRAANLGGLVSFKCLSCDYRVTKKHFKDHVCYECAPFTCQVK